MTPIPESTALVVSTDQSLDTVAFEKYLKANLSSDLVLDVLEECLLQENSTYNPIDFEQALKELQQKDSGRYHMLKALMEGFATKEGMVMLDPKLVTASYKQRLKQLELLKQWGWFRRLCYRVGLAIKVLVGQTTKTEAVQEAIQVTGEVQIAKNELAVLELRKAQTVQETNDLTVRTSKERRKVLQEADTEATAKTESIYRQARSEIAEERRRAHDVLTALYEQIEEARRDLDRYWESGAKQPPKRVVPKREPPRTNILYSPYSVSRSASASASDSASASISLSASPSPSASASPSASPEWDEDDYQ